ncbi:hypothetical protein CALCODRAFT_513129 [Calocera cornea HHB12733]|uniref:Uncharacterized protein n=1 Tax=Calocera cornea HHB12733 TaxID=1353952 RepID=A0A165CFZ1_9BASI|nr:hypothetical protein CALCODRAFT_513129 [Calocera cornea HHB12733]
MSMEGTTPPRVTVTIVVPPTHHLVSPQSANQPRKLLNLAKDVVLKVQPHGQPGARQLARSTTPTRVSILESRNRASRVNCAPQGRAQFDWMQRFVTVPQANVPHVRSPIREGTSWSPRAGYTDMAAIESPAPQPSTPVRATPSVAESETEQEFDTEQEFESETEGNMGGQDEGDSAGRPQLAMYPVIVEESALAAHY